MFLSLFKNSNHKIGYYLKNGQNGEYRSCSISIEYLEHSLCKLKNHMVFLCIEKQNARFMRLVCSLNRARDKVHVLCNTSNRKGFLSFFPPSWSVETVR